MAQVKPLLLKPFLTGQGFALLGQNDQARLIENFVATRHGTLRTLHGPCTYEVRGTTLTAASGVFHATLGDDSTRVLLCRDGTTMYMHISGDWVSIKTGLSHDTRSGYPDMWVVLNDRIIWSNGVSRALQIDGYGRVFELGFDITPAAPTAVGPLTDQTDTANRYPNYAMSWPGQIGTIGEVLSGEIGTLMRAEYRHAIQLVHQNGDLSPLSPLSNVAVIQEIRANPYFTGATPAQASRAEVSDLLRQLWVSAGATKDNGDVKAVWLFRTKDILRYGNQLYFIAEIPGGSEIAHPDRLSDAYVGFPAEDMIEVPLIHAMCNHNGSLIIANGARVYRSKPGLAGTFGKNDWTDPGRNAKVRAVASFAGMLLAWTDSDVIDITPATGRWSDPRTLLDGAGTPGPRTVIVVPGTGLLWLSRTSAFLMTQDGAITEVGSSQTDTLMYKVNRQAMCRAVSTTWTATGEALIVLPRAGRRTQTLVLGFDGRGLWRQYNTQHDIRDICLREDGMVLFAGNDVPGSGSTSSVFAWDHEHQNYSTPARYATWQSGWISYDEVGTPFTVRDIIFSVVDASSAYFEVTLYRNGSWTTPLAASISKMAINADYGSGIYTDRIGTGINGTAKMREPRSARRQIHCGKHLDGVTSFAFRIRMPYPGYGHIGPHFEVHVAPLQVDGGANTGYGRLWAEPDAT